MTYDCGCACHLLCFFPLVIFFYHLQLLHRNCLSISVEDSHSYKTLPASYHGSESWIGALVNSQPLCLCQSPVITVSLHALCPVHGRAPHGTIALSIQAFSAVIFNTSMYLTSFPLMNFVVMSEA